MKLENFLKIEEFLEKNSATNINKEIKELRNTSHKTLESFSKYTYLQVTDLIEINFWGVCYLRGAITFNTRDKGVMFPYESTHNIFYCNHIKKLIQISATVY